MTRRAIHVSFIRLAAVPILSAFALHPILCLVPAGLRLSRTRISLRHAPHSNSFLLRSRASPVHKFHATSFPSTTHRTTTHVHRYWKQSGPFQRLIRWLNFIPQNYILFGILGINRFVFAAWSYIQMFYLRTSPVRPPSVSQFRRVFAAHSVQGTGSRYGVPPPDVKWLPRWFQDNSFTTYHNR